MSAETRLPLTLEEEVVLLRAQVTELQARGTKQMMDARAAALEAAAKECNAVVTEYEWPYSGSVCSRTASLCALAILDLGRR